MEAVNLRYGDLLYLPDECGRWGKMFTYISPDPNDASRIIVHQLSDENRYSVLSAAVRLPRVVRGDDAIPQTEPAGSTPAPADLLAEPADEAGPAGPGGHGRAREGAGITDAQRRRLFGRAQALGLDIDDLRAMTPAGSISRLSRAEAARLLARLDRHGDGPAAVPGAMTARQLGLLNELRGELGFTDGQLAAWMEPRFGVRSFAEVGDSRRASRIIAALIGMAGKRRRERTADPPADGQDESAPRSGRPARTGTGGA